MSMILLVGMSVTRIVSTLAIVKVSSSAFGPEVFGALSHVIGISAVFYMFAGGGLANGLIRHVAAAGDAAQRASWLVAASVISIGSALVLAILCVALYLWGGDLVLLDGALAPLFLVIGVSQAVVGLGNTALAFLSGVGNVRAFAGANAVGSLITAAIVIGAIQVGGVWGAYIAVATLPLAPAILGIGLLLRRYGVQLAWPLVARRAQVTELLRFSLAMLIGVVAVPTVQALMRIGMADRLGWESVGHWQAIARISDAYMQVFGVLFINLLLPRLSAVAGAARRDMALRLGGAFVVLFLAGTLVYYLLRQQIIVFAFSPEFLPAIALLPIQSTGDLFKICSWIIVYYYVAGGLVRVMIAAELAQASLTMVAFLVLAPLAGEAAAVMAHALSCGIVLAGLGVAAASGRLGSLRGAVR